MLVKTNPMKKYFKKIEIEQLITIKIETTENIR